MCAKNSCIIESGRGADRGIDGANLTYQLRQQVIRAMKPLQSVLLIIPPFYALHKGV